MDPLCFVGFGLQPSSPHALLEAIPMRAEADRGAQQAESEREREIEREREGERGWDAAAARVMLQDAAIDALTRAAPVHFRFWVFR